MRKVNSFGAKVKEGKNLTLLKKARVWFRQKKDVDILHYYYSFYVEGRDSHWLKGSDYHKCEICNKNLWRREGQKVFQMKHLIFIDQNGQERYTCFGINWCLKRPENAVDAVQLKAVAPPSFWEFHEIPEGSDTEDPEELETMARIEEGYYKYVFPFLKKWNDIEIDKGNVYNFYSEVTEIQECYLIFYEERASSIFMKKLLKLIGVLYE